MNYNSFAEELSFAKYELHTQKNITGEAHITP